MDSLKKHIRSVPDFPTEGILFYDISTLMKDARHFREAVDRMTWTWVGDEIDKVVGVESRGFIFAPILASRLNAGFVMVRKPGKLPADTLGRTYALEYGEDLLEMHADAISSGERVLIVDDLLATGGTARATVELVEEAGGKVVGVGFLIELEELEGREQLQGYRVEALLSY